MSICDLDASPYPENPDECLMASTDSSGELLLLMVGPGGSCGAYASFGGDPARARRRLGSAAPSCCPSRPGRNRLRARAAPRTPGERRRRPGPQWRAHGVPPSALADAAHRAPLDIQVTRTRSARRYGYASSGCSQPTVQGAPVWIECLGHRYSPLRPATAAETHPLARGRFWGSEERPRRLGGDVRLPAAFWCFLGVADSTASDRPGTCASMMSCPSHSWYRSPRMRHSMFKTPLSSLGSARLRRVRSLQGTPGGCGRLGTPTGRDQAARRSATAPGARASRLHRGRFHRHCLPRRGGSTRSTCTRRRTCSRRRPRTARSPCGGCPTPAPRSSSTSALSSCPTASCAAWALPAAQRATTSRAPRTTSTRFTPSSSSDVTPPSFTYCTKPVVPTAEIGPRVCEGACVRVRRHATPEVP